MIHGLLSLYMPGYLQTLVYMLQSTEYQPKAYLQWFWRTKDFRKVMNRRTLDPTRAATLLLLAVRLVALLQIAIAAILIYLGLWQDLVAGATFGVAILVISPIICAHILVVPLYLGRWFIAAPKEKKLIKQSEKIFASHRGIKIAVAGSYGKTTMKELLNTVLSEGLNVKATPANKNVSSSHAYFARNLSGDEEVLIIEYGEGAPGDVARFAAITQPTHAVITGIAPAHLDQYKTLDAAARDIFSVADYLQGKQVYVNGDSAATDPYIKKQYHIFDHQSALGWTVHDAKVNLQGTTFILKKGSRSLKLSSGLVGSHQVGFLTFVAAFALELGLTNEQVQNGIAKTKPFEHRMQPYQLGGAWIVDDTYNGNLEGLRAGTTLLKDVEAKRKIYVTPGLVDQGEETETVHVEAGKLIGIANPDIVVLMKNSVTPYIKRGLEIVNFTGEVRIESNPLEFYTNLNHFVAAGDLVIMQNDWTDNYA